MYSCSKFTTMLCAPGLLFALLTTTLAAPPNDTGGRTIGGGGGKGSGDSSGGDVCELPMVRGPCRSSLRRFFFNGTTQACQVFVYGGCSGNGNRFLSEDECLEACGPTPATEASYSVEFLEVVNSTTFNLRPQRISTQTFSPSETSQRPTLTSGSSATKGLNTGLQNSSAEMGPNMQINEAVQQPQNGTAVSEAMPNITNDQTGEPMDCSLPPAPGNCRASIVRYYFDNATKNCVEFTYGGCLGNSNRFESIMECQQACGGSIGFSAFNFSRSVMEKLLQSSGEDKIITNIRNNSNNRNSSRSNNSSSNSNKNSSNSQNININSNGNSSNSNIKNMNISNSNDNSSESGNISIGTVVSLDSGAAEDVLDFESILTGSWYIQNVQWTWSDYYANDTVWTLGENSTSSLGRYVAAFDPDQNGSITRTVTWPPDTLLELEFSLFVRGWSANISDKDSNPYLVLYVMALNSTEDDDSFASTNIAAGATRMKVFDLADTIQSWRLKGLESGWKRYRFVLRPRAAQSIGSRLRLLFEGSGGSRNGSAVAVDNIGLKWRQLVGSTTATAAASSAAAEGEQLPQSAAREDNVTNSIVEATRITTAAALSTKTTASPAVLSKTTAAATAALNRTTERRSSVASSSTPSSSTAGEISNLTDTNATTTTTPDEAAKFWEWWFRSTTESNDSSSTTEDPNSGHNNATTMDMSSYMWWYYLLYHTTPPPPSDPKEEEMTNLILNILKGGRGGDGKVNKPVVMRNEFQLVNNSNFTININVP